MRIVAYIGCVLAILFVLGAFAGDSAPQEAASAAIALCFAVIPYVLVRLGQLKEQKELAAAQNNALIAELHELGEKLDALKLGNSTP